MLSWVSFMLSVIYAEGRLYWVSFMLSVIYDVFHLCWVSFMLSVIYSACHLCWASFRLSVIYTECHLCWASFMLSVIFSCVSLTLRETVISPLCWVSCWVLWLNVERSILRTVPNRWHIFLDLSNTINLIFLKFKNTAFNMASCYMATRGLYYKSLTDS